MSDIFDGPEFQINAFPDTDQSLAEATEARRLSIERQASGGSNGMDVLKNLINVMGMIVTPQETTGSVSEETTECQNPTSSEDPITTSEDKTPVSEPVSSSEENTVGNEEPECDDKLNRIEPETTNTETCNCQDMMLAISSDFYRDMPCCDEDYMKIAELQKFKVALKAFPTKEALLDHIRRFIKCGNNLDREQFLFLVNVYDFPDPWEYHTFFRYHMFASDKVVGGRGDILYAFLDSIPD